MARSFNRARWLRALVVASALTLTLAFTSPVLLADPANSNIDDEPFDPRSLLRNFERTLRDGDADTEAILGALDQLAIFAMDANVSEMVATKLVDIAANDLERRKLTEPKRIYGAIMDMLGAYAAEPATAAYLEETALADKLDGDVRGNLVAARFSDVERPLEEAFIRACLDSSAVAVRLNAMAEVLRREAQAVALLEPVIARLDDADFRVRAIAVRVLGHYARDAFNAATEAESKLKAAESDADDGATDADPGALAADVEAKRAIAAHRLKVLANAAYRDDTRVRGDILNTLDAITGNKRVRIEDYADWIDAYRKGTAEPQEGNRRADWEYHGIDSYTRKIVFIIDRSISMNEVLGRYQRDRLAEADRDNVLDWNAINTRWDLAVAELCRAIDALMLVHADDAEALRASDVEFTIVVYEAEVVTWTEQLVAATEANKAAAKRWVREFETAGLTNLYGALSAAFEIAEAGELVDSIFFLTDGYATAGEYRLDQQLDGSDRSTHYRDRMAEMLSDVGRRNRLLQIAINTVGIGAHDDRTLKQLAEDSGGQYRSLGD